MGERLIELRKNIILVFLIAAVALSMVSCVRYIGVEPETAAAEIAELNQAWSGELIKVTVTELRAFDPELYPSVEGIIVAAKINIENVSFQDYIFSTDSISAYADNVLTNSAPDIAQYLDRTGEGIIDGEIAPGKLVSGYYCVVVPKGAKKLEFHFKEESKVSAQKTAVFFFDLPELEDGQLPGKSLPYNASQPIKKLNSPWSGASTKITVSGLRAIKPFSDPSAPVAPSVEKVIVAAKLKIENVSDLAYPFSADDISAYADNVLVNWSPKSAVYLDQVGESLFDKDIAPGKAVSGYYCVEAPMGTQKIELHIKEQTSQRIATFVFDLPVLEYPTTTQAPVEPESYTPPKPDNDSPSYSADPVITSFNQPWFGELTRVTAKNIRAFSPGYFPEFDNAAVGVKLEVKNLSEVEYSFSPKNIMVYADNILVDSWSKKSRAVAERLDAPGEKLIGEILAPGKLTQGYLCAEIPAGTKKIELHVTEKKSKRVVIFAFNLPAFEGAEEAPPQSHTRAVTTTTTTCAKTEAAEVTTVRQPPTTRTAPTTRPAPTTRHRATTQPAGNPFDE